MVNITDLAGMKKEMDELEIVGYDDFGQSSIESVRATFDAVRDYDRRFPIETEMARMREIAINRRK